MVNASPNACVVFLLCLVGCATQNFVHDVRSSPLTMSQTNAPIAAMQLATTDSSSMHLVQVRTAEPLHIHAHHDLVVVVKKGHGTLRLRDRVVPVRTGDALIIPRGVPHAFSNLSRVPALAIAIFSPPFDGKDMIPIQEGLIE